MEVGEARERCSETGRIAWSGAIERDAGEHPLHVLNRPQGLAQLLAVDQAVFCYRDCFEDYLAFLAPRLEQAAAAHGDVELVLNAAAAYGGERTGPFGGKRATASADTPNTICM